MEFLDDQADRLDEPLVPMVTLRAPTLLDLYGVGVDIAAALLVAAGDHPERLRSEAACVHLCGAAPVPSSSGRSSGRLVLNTNGDRQANHALWRIVLTRMSAHPDTRVYVERRTKEVDEVTALADVVEPRWRALILMAAWCGLRRGELLALRRKDIDMLHGIVAVERSVQHLRGGEVVLGPPKTAAGRRRVVMPPHVLPEVERHLETWVKAGPEALVFTSKVGDLLHPYMVQRAWEAARRAASVEHLRFHDLRHTGNTLAAATGASTKELMALGHASPQAALIYQHAREECVRVIAEALSEMASRAGVVPINISEQAVTWPTRS